MLIAFHSLHQDGYGGIVMDADGGSVARLTDDPMGDWSPAWQPRPQALVLGGKPDKINRR
jgi:hypothetical protein